MFPILYSINFYLYLYWILIMIFFKHLILQLIYQSKQIRLETFASEIFNYPFLGVFSIFISSISSLLGSPQPHRLVETW